MAWKCIHAAANVDTDIVSIRGAGWIKGFAEALGNGYSAGRAAPLSLLDKAQGSGS
jgi:hypothetical protein